MTGMLKELCYGLSESRPWFYLIAHTLSVQRLEESNDAVEDVVWFVIITSSIVLAPL